MKNKILGIMSLFLASALIFSSCTKSEIEKANESYDYNAIVPVILNLKGKPGVIQIGRTYSLFVPSRGGSTYNWQVLSGDAEFIPIPGKANYYQGFYASGSTDTLIVMSVTETTQGGKSDTWGDTLANSSGVFEGFTNRPLIGSPLAPVGFSRGYQVNQYNNNDRLFSTYQWLVAGDGATVTQNSEMGWKATVSFSTEGVVTLMMIETNSHGLVADTTMMDITVIPYCAVHNFADFAGTYTGYDHNAYGIDDDNVTFTVAVKDADARTVTVSDGFWVAMYGPNYWGETVTGGNATVLTINEDGSITFDNQLATQTEDQWDYYMGPRSAPAYWLGCDGKITLVIPYQSYWGDSYTGGFAAQLYGEKSLGGKSVVINHEGMKVPVFESTNLPPLPKK